MFVRHLLADDTHTMRFRHASSDSGSPPYTTTTRYGCFPAPSTRTTNVLASIYDFKAIGGVLRKQRIDDWWQPAKPKAEPKAAEPEILDWMLDPFYWGITRRRP
jgi:hypothetical protein